MASHDYAVLDLETRRSAEEVGGWENAHKMGISCAVLYMAGTDTFETFLENEIQRLNECLEKAAFVVGFNLIDFDYQVLTGHSQFDYGSLPTLDLLQDLKGILGHRVSLDNLARATLGAGKGADGLQALKWWKEGKIDEIIGYCRQDVKVTADLFRHGVEHGRVRYKSRDGAVMETAVDWSGRIVQLLAGR